MYPFFTRSGTLNAFSYEDMLDELASKDQDINEETLLQYGAFIVQQVGPITTYIQN